MIYYVEDDGSIRDLVVYSLNQSSMEAMGFEDGGAFFRALEKRLPDFILLDVMLPGEDGLSILKKLKSDARTRDVPVILLTAKSQEFDKVKGLDLGADDYVAKPFGVMELLSRIRAVKRRVGEREKPVELISGSIVLNVPKHQVAVCRKEILLTNKEYELLKFLLENKGFVMSRERLLDAVWGFDYFGGTRTVDVHIQTLRQKLGDAGERIRTVRGAGYSAAE